MKYKGIEIFRRFKDHQNSLQRKLLGKVFVLLTVILLMLASIPVLAQTDGVFDLTWSSVDGGGGTFSTGGSYSLGGSIGQPDAGYMSGGVYTLSGGFWGGETDNGNQKPTNILLSNTVIAENLPINTVVGTFSTTDPDADDTFTYTLVSGSGDSGNGAFNISGNQLRTSAIFDYEAQDSYSIRIRTTDQGGLFFEKTFTITVVEELDQYSIFLPLIMR